MICLDNVLWSGKVVKKDMDIETKHLEKLKENMHSNRIFLQKKELNKKEI